MWSRLLPVTAAATVAALAVSLAPGWGSQQGMRVQTDTMSVVVTVVTPSLMQHAMVLVPAGEFPMGSLAGSKDEQPVHTVYLDAFYIDRVPVTNAHYLAFLNNTGRTATDGKAYFDLGDPDCQIVERDSSLALRSPDLARRPVVEVSWYGAAAYCTWAGLRLPSEAEWEKAARGTDGRTYPWGEGIDTTLANYGDLAGSTQDVGSHPKAASPYGVLDMAGNVRTWVADYYAYDYYARSPQRNPQLATWGLDRALRGGGFLNAATQQRSTFRLGSFPSFTDGAVGCRCAGDAVAPGY